MHIHKRTDLYLTLFLPEFRHNGHASVRVEAEQESEDEFENMRRGPYARCDYFLKHTIFLIVKKITLREQTLPTGIKA